MPKSDEDTQVKRKNLCAVAAPSTARQTSTATWSWSGCTAPFTVTLMRDAKEVTKSDKIKNDTFTWKVKGEPEDEIVFTLRDSSGNEIDATTRITEQKKPTADQENTKDKDTSSKTSKPPAKESSEEGSTQVVTMHETVTTTEDPSPSSNPASIIDVEYTAQKSKTNLYVGLGALSLAVLVTIALAIWWFSRKDDEDADDREDKGHRGDRSSSEDEKRGTVAAGVRRKRSRLDHSGSESADDCDSSDDEPDKKTKKQGHSDSDDEAKAKKSRDEESDENCGDELGSSSKNRRGSGSQSTLPSPPLSPSPPTSPALAPLPIPRPRPEAQPRRTTRRKPEPDSASSLSETESDSDNMVGTPLASASSSKSRQSPPQRRRRRAAPLPPPPPSEPSTDDSSGTNGIMNESHAGAAGLGSGTRVGVAKIAEQASRLMTLTPRVKTIEEVGVVARADECRMSKRA
ncbi:hypothetical protein OIO90_000873 [Microbotryomycetes sp. JL221]|nr:hypothetical protein OIO90_000873 [Microbotryomycetes sp. JL221]